jgi:hypothetical protein
LEGVGLAAVHGIGDVIDFFTGLGSAEKAITGVDESGQQLSTAERVGYGFAATAGVVGGAAGDAERLTTSQARDLAEYLGYGKRVKDAPFNSMGQAVFSNGKNFISPDVTSHSGGVWKMFNKSGQRLGTFDALLNRIGN